MVRSQKWSYKNRRKTWFLSFSEHLNPQFFFGLRPKKFWGQTRGFLIKGGFLNINTPDESAPQPVACRLAVQGPVRVTIVISRISCTFYLILPDFSRIPTFSCRFPPRARKTDLGRKCSFPLQQNFHIVYKKYIFRRSGIFSKNYEEPTPTQCHWITLLMYGLWVFM